MDAIKRKEGGRCNRIEGRRENERTKRRGGGEEEEEGRRRE